MTTPNVMMAASRWWMLTLRGLAAILFAVLTFLRPGMSLFVLVLLFGAYALADGILSLGAVLAQPRRPKWGWLVFEGLAGIGAAAVTILWPGITALALVYIVAAWSVATGIAEISLAIAIRKEVRGEWLLGIAGALSIAFGVALAVFPATGALVLVLWLGAYALIFGILLLGVSFRVRSWTKGRREIPIGGTPTPA